METNKKIYVYCSGPLFCPEEIGGMKAISDVLENAGYGTFLPHRDGLEAFVLKHTNSKANLDFFGLKKIIDKAIFSLDVYQIVKRCEYFVFNMNGRVPDEGGVAETAIAFSVGKPIVIYKNDFRSAFNGMDNSMVTGLSFSAKISDIKQIPSHLEKTAKTLSKLGEMSYCENTMPPMLRQTIKLGETLWTTLKVIDMRKNKENLVSELAYKVSEACKNFPELFCS
ncbi:MAG: nucleoside 2-deoxyribosyltransferase [Desulfobacterales bacterium]|nr:nucleoside 2-deoxyribosyltransferase [Desulfobacterales bacterium]